MRVKEGVEFWGIDPRLSDLCDVIDQVHMDVVGREAIVTSARDGVHSEGSLHYEGRALDLRIRDLSYPDREALAEAMQEEAGPDYDVILEDDHIHLELDPD